MFALLSATGGLSLLNEAAGKAGTPLREAMFYANLDGQSVQCLLCPRECVISDGKRGFCRNRENKRGKLYSMVYGKPCVVDIGPIEKAPLYHFAPGHSRLCLTCASCNLRCKYCQNWHLSQRSLEELNHYSYSPEAIVQEAKRHKLSSISFTYTEPTVYYEYLYDISVIARQAGIKTSIVSNGYIRLEPLLKLLAILDAVKIDLKGFSEIFYEEVCSATLKPVLESLITVKKEKVWLEIVNLVIPTLNDDPKMIDEMSRWIKENLGPDVPLHFTRFFPNYKLNHLSPTPISTLESAYDIARKNGLKYVYIGNVPSHIRNSTFCPSCHRRVIQRAHFDILEMNLVNGKCEFCNFSLQGKWA
ncbi:MAG: AmmeMemoRadiSam system radical SAM enzyme [Thermodesulfobacteriota bacterium]|nr:AmmeMemoRadiSam system radical SAM enzyme [Thermodesulfobacteriota bacterium]